jgi:DNA modification methylase
MCGDSTKTEDVTLLMNDEKADMVFTDPPYNIDYQGVSDKRDKIKNDKMPDEDFVKFLYSSIMPNDTMYVCCSWQYAHLFKEAMEIMDKKPKAMIVWDKVNPAQHLDKYYKQHEIIFYYGAFGGNKTLRGDVWQLKRQRNTVHPTMKPIELIEMALIDQPNKNIIYDGFLGSGSTLIACEKNNRKCYGMELESKYVDVIVKRWQEYTGKEAFHEVSGQKFNEALNG